MENRIILFAACLLSSSLSLYAADDKLFEKYDCVILNDSTSVIVEPTGRDIHLHGNIRSEYGVRSPS